MATTYSTVWLLCCEIATILASEESKRLFNLIHINCIVKSKKKQSNNQLQELF